LVYKMLKRKTAKLTISLASSLCILVAVFMWTPTSIEGVYNAGEMYDCMCDCNHYFRVKNGVATVYSPGHRKASLIGPYKVQSDGSAKVYISSFDPKKPDEHTFTIERSYLGRLKITIADSGEEDNLIRAFPLSEAYSAIEDIEVEEVFLEGKNIVCVYYDKDHSEIRREDKPIRNK